MNDGIRVNGIRNNLQYVLKPDLAGKGAAFFEGNAGEAPADREARLWIEAIVNDTEPCVKPEEAYTVTRILEGIYTSAKTGDIYRFD
jgi:predicted dehydrogenase